MKARRRLKDSIHFFACLTIVNRQKYLCKFTRNNSLPIDNLGLTREETNAKSLSLIGSSLVLKFSLNYGNFT